MAHPEQRLISSVLTTQDYPVAVKLGVQTPQIEMFDLEWQFIEDYYRDHKVTPSREAFLSRFPTFTILDTTDIIHWSESVKAEYMHSKMMLVLNEASKAMGEGLSPMVAAEHMQAELRSMATTVVAQGEIDVIQDWEAAHDAAVQRKHKAENGQSGVPTGWLSIDLHTGGLQPGELWIPAARPGQGKSWTMARWAAEAVAHGHTALYFSLEMRWDAIAYRVHSILAYQRSREVRSLKLLTGQADLDEYAEILTDIRQTMKGKLFVSDASRGRVSPQTVSAAIERQDPAVVYVDYLTLMEHGDDWQGVAKLSGEMKQLAEQHGIPIVAASQINRQGDGKEPPDLRTLSQSDAIGQDADAVVTLAQQTPTVSRYRMAKYRNGRDNFKWYVSFKPGIGMVEEIDGNSAQAQMQTDQEDDG